MPISRHHPSRIAPALKPGPPIPTMPRCPPGPLKNWHVADYNLFWENIRLNLTRQVELFGFADRRSRELP